MYCTVVPARGGNDARITRVGAKTIATSDVIVCPPPLAVSLYVVPGTALTGTCTMVAKRPSGCTSALATCVPSGHATVIAASTGQLVPRMGSVPPGEADPPLSVGGRGV